MECSEPTTLSNSASPLQRLQPQKLADICVQKMKAGGLVCYLIRTCRRQSKSEMEVRTAMKKVVGHPTLTFEGSPSNLGYYPMDGVAHVVAAYLEEVVALRSEKR